MHFRAALVLLAPFAFSPAFAQDGEAAPPLEAPTEFEAAGSDQNWYSGEVNVLSDYRFRGVSRSDEDPALQAGFTLFPADNIYAGIRGTSLKGVDSYRARDPGLADLGDIQVDLYAGYGAPLGAGFDVDVGLQYFVFAGAEGESDYFEPYASLSYLIGPASLTGGAKYAPAQSGTGDEDMLYLFGQADISIPFRPWRFSLELGRQYWQFGDYWTWSVGAVHQLRLGDSADVELGLRYVDTSLPAQPGTDAGLVASLGFRF